jgi:hypothetical protein
MYLSLMLLTFFAIIEAVVDELDIIGGRQDLHLHVLLPDILQLLALLEPEAKSVTPNQTRGLVFGNQEPHLCVVATWYHDSCQARSLCRR